MKKFDSIESPVSAKETFQLLFTALAKDVSAGAIFALILLGLSFWKGQGATVAKDEFFHHLTYIHPFLMGVGVCMVTGSIGLKGLIIGEKSKVKLGEIIDEYISKPVLYVLSHLSGLALGAWAIIILDVLLNQQLVSHCELASVGGLGFGAMIIFASIMRLGVLMYEFRNRLKISGYTQVLYFVLMVLMFLMLASLIKQPLSTEDQYNGLAHDFSRYICGKR